MNNFVIAFTVYTNLIFLTAKLWGKIDWSWWLVFLPFILLNLLGGIPLLLQWRKRRNQKLVGKDEIGKLHAVQNLIRKFVAEEERRVSDKH